MTGSENSANQANQNNQTANKAKEINHILANELIDSFVNRLSDAEFIDFYKQLSTSSDDSISTDLLNKIREYKNKNKKYDEIEKVEDLKFDMVLRAFINSSQIKLKENRNAILGLFKSVYKLDKKDVSNLEQGLNKIWIVEAQELLESESARVNFLKKSIWNKKVKTITKNIEESLKEIKWFEFDKLSKEEQTAIKNFAVGWYVSEELITFLWKLSFDAKKSILLAFMPVLSLWILEKLWILGKEDVERIVNDRINNLVKDFGDEEKQKNAKTKILKYVDDDYKNWILVQTSALLWNIWENNSVLLGDKESINNAIDQIFTSENITSVINSIKNDIESEENRNSIRNQKDFIKRLKNSNFRNISWINNILTSWSVIAWELYENYSNRHFYLQIVSVWENSVEIFDRTHNNWIVKKVEWETRSLNYQELFNILSNISVNNWKIDIKTAEEISYQIENWAINAFEWSWKIENLNELKVALDASDPSWRDVELKVWMTFEFSWKDSSKVAIWKITNINDKWVTIASEWPLIDLSYKEFCDAFISEKWKRLTNITDYNSVIESIKKHKDWEKFRDLELKKDVLVPKNQEKNEKHPWVNFFVWKNGFLEIKKVHWDRIEVIIWTWEEKEKEYKVKKAEKTTLSYEVFYWYIIKNKLEPKIDKKLTELTEPINKKNPWKRFSFWNHVFWMQNIITIWMWAKQFVDSLKATLKENNELQAAEFALALWKVLPASMKQDLQNRVESAQKKKTKEKVDMLSQMNIVLSIQYVEKILKTSNSYQHEIEAALMFVLEKHGWLYPMTLQKYSWSYLWYEKLWWKVWDKMFKEYMRDTINDNREPTEEWLITKLLVKQSMQDDKEYFPKRRTTIVWEFFWACWNWRDNSMNAWEKEWKSYSTLWWRKWVAIWKLKEWRHMFAIWCFKSVLDKWWNPKEKNHIPFMILMSWLPKKLHQSTTGMLKWLWFGHQVPALFFCQNPWLVDAFEKIMLKFAKQEWKSCYDELLTIIKERDSWAKWEKETLEALDKYWEKYGWSLWPKLNTVDDSAYLLSKEDNDIAQYFSLAKVIADNNSKSKENFENNVYKQDNTLMLYSWWSKYFSSMVWWIQPSWILRDWLPTDVFDNFVKKIENIRSYCAPWKKAEDKESEEWRKKLFIALNRIAAVYVKDHFSSWRIMDSDIYKKLYKMGLWLPTQENYAAYSSEDIESSAFDKNFLACYPLFKNKIRENDILKQKAKTAMRVDDILKLSTVWKKWRRQDYNYSNWYPDNLFDDYDYGISA